jgi:hypothetical protein
MVWIDGETSIKVNLYQVILKHLMFGSPRLHRLPSSLASFQHRRRRVSVEVDAPSKPTTPHTCDEAAFPAPHGRHMDQQGNYKSILKGFILFLDQ